MKKHRSFKPEQKARAVLQVLTGQKSAAQICRELQIPAKRRDGSSMKLDPTIALFIQGTKSVIEEPLQRFARNPPRILKQPSIQLLPDRLSWDITHSTPPCAHVDVNQHSRQ